MRQPHSSSIKRGDGGGGQRQRSSPFDVRDGGGGGRQRQRSPPFDVRDDVGARSSPTKSRGQNFSSNSFSNQQRLLLGIGARISGVVDGGGGLDGGVIGGVIVRNSNVDASVEGFSHPPSSFVGGRWETSLPTIKSDGSFVEDSFGRNLVAGNTLSTEIGRFGEDGVSAPEEDRTGVEMRQLQQQQIQQQQIQQQQQPRMFLSSNVSGLQRRSSPAGSFGFGGGGGGGTEMEETPPRTPTSITQFWNSATKGLGLGGRGGGGATASMRTQSMETRLDNRSGPTSPLDC